jgi:hypothetical protein
MPKVDLSGFTNHELTHLIDDASSLRTTEFGDQKAGRNSASQEQKPESASQPDRAPAP